MAHNTLVHRLAVLSKAHQMREVKNPCQDPKVRELLSRTRKAYAKRGELPKKKDALTKDPLQLVLATCDVSMKGKRDRALLLFAWASGGRRRSEEHTSELQSQSKLVCRLLLEKKKPQGDTANTESTIASRKTPPCLRPHL